MPRTLKTPKKRSTSTKTTRRAREEDVESIGGWGRTSNKLNNSRKKRSF